MSLDPSVIAKPGAAGWELERTHPSSEPGPEEGAASLRSPGPAPPRAPPEKQMLREEEICSRPSLLLIDRNIQCRDALVLQRTPGGGGTCYNFLIHWTRGHSLEGACAHAQCLSPRDGQGDWQPVLRAIEVTFLGFQSCKVVSLQGI